MKIIIKQNDLFNALQAIIGVVDNNKTIPLLSTVACVATKDNKMTITATNLEVEITSQVIINAALSEDVSFTLPGKKIFDICKNLPSESDITLSVNNNKVTIQHGKHCKFNLSSLACDEFPYLDQSDSLFSFNLPQSDLLTLFQRTFFAMANHDVRFYLNGMLMEFFPDRINSVATDGHRLALNSISTTIPTQHRVQIIIPRKGVSELIRLLGTTDDTLNIEINNSFIKVSNNAFTFISKLIEGRFPDYQRVIPQHNDKELVLDKKELKDVLVRSSILCNEKFHGVKLDFNNNEFCVSSNNPDHETAEERLMVDYPYDTISIGFNINYLIENINVLETPSLKFLLASAENSMLIEELDGNHTSTFVIMPMKL